MSSWNTHHNRAVWFDIPVTDLGRARDFYAAVLQCAVTRQPAATGAPASAVFESAGGNGGCLVVAPEQAGARGGVLLYLNVNGRIRDAIEQAAARGGRLLQTVQPIGGYGVRAILLDSEGNRIALYAEQDG
ncbi:MAG: VOC family protein [Nevskiales bacterium]|nr:VOC family protein [Nevskiales bacterium]